MAKRRLVLVVIDVRSAYNVGSLLRTADAMAVEAVYLVGITPYPMMPNDKRLPHVIARAEREIHKTALGAEKSLKIIHVEKPKLAEALEALRAEGFTINALEQTSKATPLERFTTPPAIALLVGNEVKGLDQASLRLSDQQLAISMLGKKESLNVSVATGIALYHLRYASEVDKAKL